MDNILKKDRKLGKIRNHASETKSLSESMKEYGTGLRALNFEYGPYAFQLAFQNHIIALENMGKSTENYPALFGEIHNVFDRPEEKESKQNQIFKELLKAIWDTWEAIETAKSVSK